MAKLIVSYVLLFLVILILPITFTTAYNVVNFGARPDGQTDSTEPFLLAWSDACRSVRPATVYVPRGVFLVKSVRFSGPCKSRIVFQIDGTIVAPWDYNALGKSGFWILFYKVARVWVRGGMIDARGAGFWACRRTKSYCPAGARVCHTLPAIILQFQCMSTLFLYLWIWLAFHVTKIRRDKFYHRSL